MIINHLITKQVINKVNDSESESFVHKEQVYLQICQIKGFYDSDSESFYKEISIK